MEEAPEEAITGENSDNPGEAPRIKAESKCEGSHVAEAADPGESDVELVIWKCNCSECMKRKAPVQIDDEESKGPFDFPAEVDDEDAKSESSLAAETACPVDARVGGHKKLLAKKTGDAAGRTQAKDADHTAVATSKGEDSAAEKSKDEDSEEGLVWAKITWRKKHPPGGYVMSGPYKKGNKKGKHLVGVTKHECRAYVKILEQMLHLVRHGQLSDVDKAAAQIKKRELIASNA